MFKKCQLKKVERFSGSKGNVYAVFLEDELDSEFTKFIKQFSNKYKKEVADILGRLHTMGHNTGMVEYFFKTKEGIPGDGVCALYDKEESNLRLYCVRYGSQLVVLGGGGFKSKNIRAHQEDPILEKANEVVKYLSQAITKKMKLKEMGFDEDGFDFTGDLTITEDDLL